MTVQSISGSKVPDWHQVMEASRSIMGEIVLEKLLPKLLKTILEMSKATKGAIVLTRETGLEIAAIGTSNPTIHISMRSVSCAVAQSLQLERNN